MNFTAEEILAGGTVLSSATTTQARPVPQLLADPLLFNTCAGHSESADAASADFEISSQNGSKATPDQSIALSTAPITNEWFRQEESSTRQVNSSSGMPLRGPRKCDLTDIRVRSTDCLSPEGSQFASAGSDGTIRVWDANTGTEIRSLGGHTGEAYCVLFSRDGSLLISGGGTQDQPGEVIIRNAATGEELRRLNGHIGSVLSLAISTDGKLLASGGLDEIIRIWNLQSGEIGQRDSWTHRTNLVDRVWAGSGRIMSSSSDRTLRRWNVQTGEQIDVWVNNDRSQPSMELHHTAVNRHGDLIATAASNKFVYLWITRERSWPVSPAIRWHQSAWHSLPMANSCFCGC